MGRMLAGRCDSPDDTARAVEGVTAGQVADIAKKITLDTVYFMLGTLAPDKASGSEGEETNE